MVLARCLRFFLGILDKKKKKDFYVKCHEPRFSEFLGTIITRI